MDGNFSAVHQKCHNAVPEQCLTNGDLYMASENHCRAHLASAVEYKEVRHLSCDCTISTNIDLMSQPMTCNEHHAIKDRFVSHKGLDVTGIGATACARHGCFCPGSVVNFVKGES